MQHYKSHSLNISPFYVCFLFIRFPLYVLGSYYRLARVRFAWLRSSREDLFQSTSVTLRRHGRSTNRLLRVSGTHGLSGIGKLHGNTHCRTPRHIFWNLDMIILRPPGERSSLYSAESLRHLISRRNIRIMLCETLQSSFY